jgi:aryl-alcohol dehydrogenase-like predicted oxidoreductase
MMSGTPMRFRPLGRTGLNVSVASLGSGGDSRLGQSTHGSREDSHRVIRHALDLGINLIDTAPVYMDSERILGEALREVPRASYILSTKATPRKDGAVASVEQITSSCEESLRRLQTDYVDVFMFHGVTRAEYPGIREHLYPVARRLQEQGKVRFIGVTEPMPGAALEPGSKNAVTAEETASGGSAFTVHEMDVQAANEGIWHEEMHN